MQSWLERACTAANLAPSECANVLHLSSEAFAQKMHYPGMLTLDELNVLYAFFDEEAKRIMWEALQDFKPR